MTNHKLLIAALLLCRAALADAGAAPACTPAGRIVPICGVHAPEDLELLPDGGHLLVSQAAAPHDPAAGGLAVLDLASKRIEPLPISAEFKPGWGDASCTEPFRPRGTHGIHLSQRRDGAWQLLAVNHGAREAIEAFELQRQDGRYRAIWRGCVVNGTDGMHNDVAALPDGGFIATVMFPNELKRQKDIFDAMISGRYPGYLVEWHPDTGMQRLPGSEAQFDNGVQVSHDGRQVYFNAWVGGQIGSYDRRARRIVRTAAVPFHPDNLSVRADGALLAAGIDELRAFKTCMSAHAGFCQAGFAVAAFDPKTNRATPLYRGEPGLIAGASVALQVGNRLYVGAYAGDRILQIDLGE